MAAIEKMQICPNCQQEMCPIVTEVLVETKHLQTQAPVVYDRLQSQCPHCGQGVSLTTEQTLENLKRLRQVILS